MQHAQGVLLFLVRFNNSARFEIYGFTRSSSSRPFLCALVIMDVPVQRLSSLEPRLSVPDFVSQLWRKLRDKIWNGKPVFEASVWQACPPPLPPI